MLDITNGDQQHWNTVSSTRQVRIICKYKARVQLLIAVDELHVPAFVEHDEMRDQVDDIDTMCD
jgi:hypothetical protein